MIECPRCNNDDISITAKDDYEENTETKYMICNKCKFEFVEFWECTGWKLTGKTYTDHGEDDREFKPEEKFIKLQEGTFIQENN